MTTSTGTQHNVSGWHSGGALLVFCCAVTLYTLTMASSVGFHDEAELALRGHQLGATHAPGAPLHTLVVYMLDGLLGDPALASVWLSVISAALGAAVLVYLFALLGTSAALATTGALCFAALLPIWSNAVVSELYALSLLCVLLTLCLALQADSRRFPWAMSLAAGFSLAAHFANVLLLPLWCLCLYFDSERTRKFKDGCAFGVLAVLSICLVAAANAWLASRVSPFGEFTPTTLGGLLGYMSGSEHAPLASRDFAFYTARIAEHAQILAKNFFYIGMPFAFVGFITVYKERPRSALLLLLISMTYLGYFTLFGSGDYFLMVGPAYLVLMVLWVFGVEQLVIWLAPRATQVLAPAAFAALALLSVIVQFPAHREAALSTQAIDYAQEALTSLPANSIAVARWNEFTTLRYLQVVHGMRPDVDLLVPARSVRHYQHGDVQDYLNFIELNICSRPIATNKLAPDMDVNFRPVDLEGTGLWKQLRPIGDDYCE